MLEKKRKRNPQLMRKLSSVVKTLQQRKTSTKFLLEVGTAALEVSVKVTHTVNPTIKETPVTGEKVSRKCLTKITMKKVQRKAPVQRKFSERQKNTSTAPEHHLVLRQVFDDRLGVDHQVRVTTLSPPAAGFWVYPDPTLAPVVL